MKNLSSKTNKLKKIKEEVIRCHKCSLYKRRTLPVIGEGNHQAKIMFIGEAPGANEDRTGRPFCGEAGKILDKLLESVNLKRKDVYITNILKCRPPNNRDPQKEEIEACVPYLLRQIEIIKPKIICTLGNYATTYILEKFGLKEKIQGISRIRGQILQANNFKIIPLYHPAVAVYNQNMEATLKKDFQKLKNL